MENNKLDAWGDHVEEYSKRQKQLHQELVNRKLMEQELKNTMTEKMNDNIQTNPDVRWTERKPSNTVTWSENKRWLVAVIGLLCVIGFVSALFVYDLFWYAIIGVSGVWLLGVLLTLSKNIVDALIDGW